MTKRMTTDRFREILDLLNWTQRGLAIPLKCSDKVPREWARGKEPIPDGIAEWLENLAAVHEKHPPPTDWRRPRFGRAA